MKDPQFGSITTVEDPDLGPLKMPNMMFRLSATPGCVWWAGRSKAQHNEEVYRETLGLNSD